MTSPAIALPDPTRTGLPPGPSMPGIMQALHLWRRPLAFMDECTRRFGDCFTIRIPSLATDVFFSDPEAVREIFTADVDVARAGEANAIVEPLLGASSLLRLDGPRHLRERRLMLPPFHGERMQAYGEVMREITDREIDRWPAGRPFPIRLSMQRITLDVIIRTVFGVAEGPMLERLRDRLEAVLAVGTNPTILWPPLQLDLGAWSPWGRLVRARGEVRALLGAEIGRRRAENLAAADILTMLVAARDEDGQPLSDEDLTDQMMTLLFAGHETTATALAWTFHRVLGRPDVLAKIRKEYQQVVGTGPLRPEHVARLEYLDAVVKETMRLDPIIPEVGRRLSRPLRIGGWDLPAGVVVAPCIYLVHRRADRWPDPERFDPERFVGARPGPYEFFPFGGGVRRCIGMAFALYEMKIVLSRVFARTDLTLAAGYRARPVRRAVTLAPSRGMPVVMSERRSPR